jgi:hypothetical protein
LQTLTGLPTLQAEKSVSLTGAQRQTQAQCQDAIQTLRPSPEQDFEKLEKLGTVRSVLYPERAKAVEEIR